MSTQFHVLKLMQGGSPLVDFVDLTNYVPNSFSPDLFPTAQRAQSVLNFDVRGTSNDNLIDNLVTLDRALKNIQDNLNRFELGLPFTPIFLQLKLAGSTTTLQTEILDAKLDKPANFIAKPIVASRFQGLNLTLTHRPYFEETAAVALSGSPFTASNNAALINITSTDIRGDLPAPLKIVCRAGAAGITRVSAGLKAVGTVANFVAKVEAESYNARGAGVADLSDANLSLGQPPAPSLTPSASGGTLATATYFYKIATIDAYGNESLGGTEASVAVTGPTGSVAISWTAQSGAASYRIYRGTAAGAENVYYTSSTNSFTDTGAANTSGTPKTVNAQRWTPGVTTEQMFARWIVTPATVDEYGKYRVFVRCRDNAAAPNVKMRVRSSMYAQTLGTPIYGDYGDVKKFVGVVGGTTVLPLVDCGIISLPAVDMSGASVNVQLIFLDVTAVATGVGTFDVDCLYLIPCYEGGDESGFFSASFTEALGTNAQPDGVLDANDRIADAYVIDGSGNIAYPATDLRGDPILAWPARAQKLIVLANISANTTHDWNQNNTLTITYTPRYRLARGT